MHLDKGHLLFLSTLYPTVPWKDVIFHEGIPWHSPFPIVLPGTYDNSRVHVFVRKVNGYEQQHLSTLVHEAYHVQQFYDIGEKGLGFYRKFIPKYLSGWMKYGYRNHPLEIPAFHTEELFNAHFHMYSREFHYPKTEQDLVALSDKMTQTGSQYFPITKSIHTVKTNWAFSSLGILLTLLIVPVKPIVELILLIPYLLMFRARLR